MSLVYDPKGMPFRRLGPSGLRVPVFSLGGCECSRVVVHAVRTLTRMLGIVVLCFVGLTLGESVTGTSVKVLSMLNKE